MDQLYFSIVPLFTFVLMPLFDTLLPPISATFSDRSTNNNAMYRFSLYIFAAVQTFVLIYSCYRSQELLQQGRYLVYFLQIISLALIATAPSAAVAHELIHKLNHYDRLLGKFLFAQFLYSHFPIEHLHGHHKNVATDADPASARRGETIYSFFIRSTVGTLKHTWEIETSRLEAKYGTHIPLRAYLLEHHILHCIVIGDILLPICIYLIMGPYVLITFILQAFLSIFFSESVNYLEHYGLRRKKLENGQYEPISEQHSWDAPFVFNCYFYVNLALHADHHSHPLKSYHQLLPASKEAPVLPCGYATLFLLALVPPLYFNIMHNLPALKSDDQQQCK